MEEIMERLVGRLDGILARKFAEGNDSEEKLSQEVVPAMMEAVAAELANLESRIRRLEKDSGN